MISFPCTHCQSPLKAEANRAGLKLKCPRCLKVVVVPKSADDVAPETFPDLKDVLAPARAPGEMGWLGPYRVLKVLGHGGMGVVFQAEDPQLGRPVALKAILPHYARNPNARQRFFREARAAAGLKHDNIVAIYQVGEDRGVPFQAMEFLTGESLDTRLKRDKLLPLPEVLRIGRDVAEGLAEAHSQNLIHRDIKPANIWLEIKKKDEKGKVSDPPLPLSLSLPTSKYRVKLLDFGLARDVKEDTQITQSGMIVGTPAYMAPEQARGLPIDARADLFSLGCVLYRMATGQLPFKGENTIALLSSLAMDTPATPREVSPELPKSFSDVVMKFLEKDPAKRLGSAREAADALQNQLDNPDPVVVKKAWWKRRWVWAGAVVLMLLLIIVNADKNKPEENKTDPLPNPIVQEPSKDSSLFARMSRDKISADDLIWAFGKLPPKVTIPGELVGIIRNTSIVTASAAHLSGFALSADGRWLAQGGPGFQVDLFDFATGTPHPGSISSHALGYIFQQRPTQLLTGSSSAFITARNLATQKETIVFTGPTGVTATAFAMHPDEKIFFIGTSQGQVLALQTTSWTELPRNPAHTAAITAFAIHPDGKRILSGDAEGSIKLWLNRPLLAPKTLFDFPNILGKNKIRQMIFSPKDHHLLVAVEGSAKVHRYDLLAKLSKVVKSEFQQPSSLAAFAVSIEGDHLATLGSTGSLRLWDYGKESLIGSLELPPCGDDQGYGPLTFTPEGRHLLIGHPKGAVLVLRLDSMKK